MGHEYQGIRWDLERAERQLFFSRLFSSTISYLLSSYEFQEFFNKQAS